ncbi:hypothetical protein CgunFtcFv8_021094 [Champsocephalus gunnari]|uniref:Uncharacterized protein n=1 Tax=Champsocephalus gunnari TaxID=52237 RepID=A0AAN8ES13_CHAGU|nr:hypothetical protein CgunFtcFv8_021094 [Champsocephalus gunnari]
MSGDFSGRDIAFVNRVFAGKRYNMNVSKEREHGVSSSEVTLSDPHDNKTRAVHPQTQERPDSPGPPCVSSRSDRSMSEPIQFKNMGPSVELSPMKQERPDSPGPTCVSVRSDRSMTEPIEFNNEGPIVESRFPRMRSVVIKGRPANKHPPHLDSIFMLLEESIVTFVKKELKKFKRVLESSERLEGLKEEDDSLEDEDEEQGSSNRDAFLTLTLNFLRNMKQEELADSLQSKSLISICQRLTIVESFG